MRQYIKSFLLIVLMTTLLTACGDNAENENKKAREVVLLDISTKPVPRSVELSGRVSAFQKAEVRPQVNGILQKRLFTEGSLVAEGQALYKIDPALYAANLESAKAELASAQAKYTAAKTRRERMRALVRDKAVSQQAYEDAEAEYLQTRANIDICRASLKTAAIRLEYTDVLAPISGRIGKSNFTQGALVTANQGEPLSVIQQLDPVYVDLTRSSLNLLKVRTEYEKGILTQPTADSAKVKLRLENQEIYPLDGELKFADITVNEGTGMVLMRAVFPNPERVLLPGMYVRAYIDLGVEEKAILVPQLCVSRDAKGIATLLVLKGKDDVERRVIEIEGRYGKFWIVRKGLTIGEKVVVDGFHNLRVGTKVRVKGVKTLDELLSAQK